MRDDRQAQIAERDRRIREAIRSAGDVRADAAFRERLKRRFVDGTIGEAADRQTQPEDRGLPRWWWILVPAAAVVLLVALLLPRPVPNWTVQALRGDGRVEVEGQTLAVEDTAGLARAIGAGGRVRLPEGVSLDVRLADHLLLELAEGADVVLPVPQDGGTEGPLIGKVHHGELRIKTGPGFPGTEMHILTAEGRTEITGTIISVYKGNGYTCVCVLEGTARAGAGEDRLEEIPPGMLKTMFNDGSPPIVTDIAEQHRDGLVEFGDRHKGAFPERE